MMPALAAAGGGAQLHARIEWAGVPTGATGLAALVLAAAIVAGIVLLYHRERATGASRLRWLCAGLRVLCLVVLGLILLRPSLAVDVERLVPGRVIALADRSASMSVRDANLPPELAKAWQEALGLSSSADPSGLTRNDLLRGLLARSDCALIRDMARANEVDLRTFAESVRSVLKLPREGGNAAAVTLPGWSPTGAATDLGGALRAALDEQGEGPLAAVVILTDGRDTEGGDLDAVADVAARRAVKLDFVGVGSPLAAANVELVELFAADHAIRGLPFPLRAFVESQGYEGRAAVLTLTATQVRTGETVEAARRQIALAADGMRQAVDFSDIPQAAGPVRYAASIEPLPGESRTDDNAASREVLVTDQKIGVLLVSGGPSLDYRFLKAAIERDPAFALTVQLSGAATEAGAPPADLSAFDVILLCDPATEQVGAEWLTRAAGLVDREGVGLAFMAGPAYSPELLSDPALGVLRDLLPVAVDAARTRALIGAAGTFTEPRPVELAEGGRGHPITSTAGEDAKFWDNVPPVYWVLPAERQKAGATVLLRCADPAFSGGMALAAVQPYGLGSVFYCGTPETWRWRQLGIEPYDRFWLQALRYCAAGHLAGADRRARISLERSVYALGEPVTVRARLLDAQLRPLEDAGAELGVELSGALVGKVELRRLANEPGLYEGVFYPEQFGSFELVYEMPDGVRAAASLQVRRPQVEFKDLRMAEPTMRELAARTGGSYLGPAEAARLPSLIPDLSRTVTEPGPLEPLWDTPYLLALLVAALAAEWMMRKRMGLL